MLYELDEIDTLRETLAEELGIDPDSPMLSHVVGQILRHGCCVKARQRHCVCEYHCTCPDHSPRHVGGHD